MKRLLLYFSLVFALATPSLSQQPRTHSLRGIVADVNGGRIVSARVMLRGPNVRESVSVTDDEGRFAFHDLTSGDYDLYVSANGFSDAEARLHVNADIVHEVTLSVGESQFAVTAEIGQSEDVNKIPQPVTIISRDEIHQRSTSVLAQIAKEEVGLNVQRTSPTIGAVVVRGLTGKNVSNYVDGVRYTNGAQRGGINTFFNLNDASSLQGVEVLRGPNSAQYGSDSLGGTVNLLTRSPVFGGDKAEFHGELSPGFNSADRSFGSSAFFSYGTQKLGGSISLGARKVNTLRTADAVDSHSAITRFLGLPSTILYTRSPYTDFIQYVGAAKVNYSPTDKQQLIFYYQRGQQDGGKRFDQLIGGDGNLIADLRNLMLDFGYVRFVTSEFPAFASASFTVSYNSQREERVNQGGQGNPFGDITHQYERTSATGFSFHLDRKLPGRNTFLIGGDFYHEKINSPAYMVNAADVVTISRPRVPDEATFDSAGLFVQNVWDAIPDRLRVSGALRYSGVIYKARAADAPIVGGRRLWNDDSLRTADYSGRIGATLRLVDGVRAAFNYSRGFRYPSMTDLGTLGLTGDGFEVDHLAALNLGGTIGTTALESAVSTGVPVSVQRSEYSDNFDLGIRFQNKRFEMEATAFQLDIKDAITKQALILPPGSTGQSLGDREITSQLPNGTVFVQDVATPVLVRANFTAARLRGFEFATKARLTQTFSGRANFTYVRASDPVTGLPPNIEGGTPPPTGFVSLRYSRPKFWIEAYSTLAAKQDRLSSLDLGDRRTGAARSRAQIQNYFRRGACVNGLTTAGPTGCGSAGGILLATGETLAQVQNRLLPIGATINGVTIADNNTAVPLFTYLPRYATANIRGSFSFTENSSIFVAFENITDAFYRNPSWGIDGTGRSLTIQLRYKF